MTPQLLKVLDDIKYHRIFSDFDFRLAGGTALAYHINHRLSEDLDFFINGKLPKNDIDIFIEDCILMYGKENITPIPLSQNILYEFEIADEDVEDYQQDWNINGVKVTFCDSSSNIGSCDIFSQDNFVLYDKVKIMSVDSIFKMKSLMFYKRVKVRDYFDLYTLYNDTNLNYTPKMTLDLIQKYELLYSFDMSLFFITLEEKIKGYDSKFDSPLHTIIKNPPTFKALSNNILQRLMEA
ncbi:nucleotidyl transferase AbiEii/AbiGii toxin family protein [Arcobacter sp. FWKO B]|uniref:nucleotidyl transferase AbiEii/AbiGii toxin family protein n=1 Tax=Arcobacter sp. FWKO B TaxID=2593672 RepID=UPI0018A5FED0|nr:nucleotidyl transferase AbiEii/AbiGii toxin family protein [Arcobacter sp. FWKO B]QOG12800.1 nucleotidyl transferase AbiEii/AbiGii toxin family protein [Arcobacter sp. FWKO B]